MKKIMDIIAFYSVMVIALVYFAVYFPVVIILGGITAIVAAARYSIKKIRNKVD